MAHEESEKVADINVVRMLFLADDTLLVLALGPVRPVTIAEDCDPSILPVFDEDRALVVPCGAVRPLPLAYKVIHLGSNVGSVPTMLPFTVCHPNTALRANQTKHEEVLLLAVDAGDALALGLAERD